MKTNSRRTSAVPGASLPAVELACADFEANLGEFVEESMEASDMPADNPMLHHAGRCARCARRYTQLLPLLSAADLRSVQDTWFVDQPAPAVAPGLLRSWRVQVGLCDRIGDRSGTALAMAVCAMLLRRSAVGAGAEGAAGQLLAEAIRAGAACGHPFSQVLGHAELGDMALRRGELGAAGEHVDSALELAHAAGDSVLLASVMRFEARPRRVDRQARPDDARPDDAQAGGVLQDFLMAVFGAQPVYGFAAGGDRMLLANSGSHVGYELLGGPMLDRSGRIEVVLRMDPATVRALPAGSILEVLFLPTDSVVISASLDAPARSALAAIRGLRLRGAVPGAATILDDLAPEVPAGAPEPAAQALPRAAVAFKIRW